MSRLLRTDLPDDVWLRLQAEAEQHNMKIGAYLKHLIMTRDAKRTIRDSDTSPTRDEGDKP